MACYLIDGVPLPVQVCEPDKHTNDCVGITAHHYAPVYLNVEQTKFLIAILLKHIEKKEQAEGTQ